jgi:hypothetical protein
MKTLAKTTPFWLMFSPHTAFHDLHLHQNLRSILIQNNVFSYVWSICVHVLIHFGNEFGASEPDFLKVDRRAGIHRHVRAVPVGDIDDSASIVDFSANRYELVCSRNRAVRSFGARCGGVCSGAGEGGYCLRRRVEYEGEDE